MNREEIKLTQKGFSISPTQEYIEKQDREKRIQQRKNKTGKITNEEIYQYLNDTNDRIEEIYELTKALSKLKVL